MPNTTKPLAIYCRVSSRGERSDETYHSPAEQEAAARSHAESRGYTTDGVFFDEDVSGGTHPEERPAMHALLEALRAGVVGGVTAFGLDRLSRDPAHGDWLVAEVTRAGGVVTTPDMPEDITTPTGEFTFGLLLGVARLYRRQAGSRFAIAKKRATLAGIPVGPPALGYRLGEGRVLELDPDTAPIVRQLFERRALGAGYIALASWLQGVAPRASGRVWSPSTIDKIVRRRLYVEGRLEYDGVRAEVGCGRIVDEALWAAAQAEAVNPHAAPRAPRGRYPWMLTGLLRCRECGRTLMPSRGSKSKGHGHYRRYRCPSIPAVCSSRPSVKAEVIEAIVTAAAFEVAGIIEALPVEEVDLTALVEVLEVAERRLAQATTPAAQDALGDAWLDAVADRRATRDGAAEALGRARLEAPASAGATYSLGHLWEDLGPEAQREALRWYFGAVLLGATARGVDPGEDDVTFERRATRAWSPIEVTPWTLGAE